ncbi:MAG: hypothetical protein Q9169_005429 [Polycauliona sp. 2 TL-2023]
MSLTLRRKRSSASLSKDGSETTGSCSIRPGKNPAVKSRRYEQLLAMAGIHMDNVDHVTPHQECETLCQTLLETDQAIPQDSLFRTDIFERVCARVRNKNEARVVRDLTPLLVPSAEISYLRGAVDLKDLIETVDEGWLSAIPLVNGPPPQPDFGVGFKSSAFTSEQLRKLQPSIGGWQSTSRIVATDEMYFPFLTAEVKCGNEALNIADRQNAHNAAFGAVAVVELYRLVSRQEELHQKMLTFSISHDHENVKIYGHYVLVDGKDTRVHRHLIDAFSIVARGGQNRWTAYKFTQSVYRKYAPIHLTRITSAVDQLPDPGVFNVAEVESASLDDSQPVSSHTEVTEPAVVSSATSEPVFKKPKGKGKGKKR